MHSQKYPVSFQNQIPDSMQMIRFSTSRITKQEAERNQDFIYLLSNWYKKVA